MLASLQHSLSVGLVTSLAANNADLQTNLAKNGVLWSLLLFLFEYDYTLDESGVNTDEKSNQQKVANNLAKLSVLAIVALSGYDLKLILDPNDPLNSAIKSQNSVRKNSGGTPTGTISSGSSLKSTTSSPTSASAYTSNATNIIQNNAVHTNNFGKTSQFTSYINLNEKVSSSEEVFEPMDTPCVVEKENLASNKKYEISGTATNSIVKKIIDKLLTNFISEKLATQKESEVNKLLNVSNLLVRCKVAYIYLKMVRHTLMCIRPTDSSIFI